MLEIKATPKKQNYSLGLAFWSLGYDKLLTGYLSKPMR